MLVHLAEDIEGVTENLVALELRLGPVGGALLDFKSISITQIVAESVHCFAEHTIGFALVHFKRPDLVDEVVEDVTHKQGVQHPEPEIDGELQSGLARGGLDSVTVLEQEHAEAIEAGILQRKAVLRFVHSEATGTA